MHRPTVSAALDHVVSLLRDAKIAADVEPAKVRVPGAWVTATQYAHTLMGGGGEVTVEIYLVVNDRPGPVAWRELDKLFSRALEAGISPSEPTRTNEAIQLQGPHPLPAYVITTTVENC